MSTTGGVFVSAPSLFVSSSNISRASLNDWATVTVKLLALSKQNKHFNSIVGYLMIAERADELYNTEVNENP